MSDCPPGCRVNFNIFQSTGIETLEKAGLKNPEVLKYERPMLYIATFTAVKMEPKEISITQLLQHEVLFVMVFPEALPNDVKDAYAHFGDMPAVELKKKNDFNLIGAVPASLKPGKVQVRVTSSAGDQLGETWFECLDKMPDMFERLMGDPDLQRSFFALWNEHQGRQ